MVEPAAPRGLVEKFILDDETYVDAFDPAVLVPFVPKPFIEFGKLAVVEVPSCNDDGINAATSRVKGVVGQRAPQVDSD